MHDKQLHRLVTTQSTHLPIDQISRFAVLNSVLSVWRRVGGGEIPRALDPLDLPPSALRHVMLIDLVAEPRDAVVRLAGTLPCELYGAEMRGLSVDRFFTPKDVDMVLDDLFEVARTGLPTLTEWAYVAINDKLWAYTRLLLPLRPDGENVTQIFKLIEPNSFRRARPDRS